jgi:hypothetical protein
VSDYEKEWQEKMTRYERARRDAATCGKCGKPLPLPAPVWLQRLRALSGWRKSIRLVPICADCRGDWYPSNWSQGHCVNCGRCVYHCKHRGDYRLTHVSCSQRCRIAIHNALAKAKRPDRNKTCATCGKAFLAPRADAVTCSPACRQKAYRQRLAAK